MAVGSPVSTEQESTREAHPVLPFNVYILSTCTCKRASSPGFADEQNHGWVQVIS